MLTPIDQTFRRIVWPFAIAEALVWASFYYSFPAGRGQWAGQKPSFQAPLLQP
jgi:hypothetical protein